MINLAIYLWFTVWMLQWSRGCDENEWQCHDGRRCINKNFVCDKLIHCTDGSDEKPEVCLKWKCPIGRWRCETGNQCIDENKVCDGEIWGLDENRRGMVGGIQWNGNCQDLSDEAHDLCANTNCSRKGLKCRLSIEGIYWLKSCLAFEKLCDDVQDCHDNSDESSVMCSRKTCPSGQWKCDDGQCIDITNVCDGISFHCKDYSDEAHCDNWVCPKGSWQCKSGDQCIHNNAVCTNEVILDSPGCRDNSQNDADVCRDWQCAEGFWKCVDNSSCIKLTHIMDGFYSHCLDGSDEDPSLHVGRVCSAGYHICDDKLQCIEEKYWCDGRDADVETPSGCNDGSDEGLHCLHTDCLPDYWKCANNLQCISVYKVCNGWKDCNDGSDEHNQLCGCDGDWPCHDGDGCIRATAVCDGEDSCTDGSDELYQVCDNFTCLEGTWTCQNRKCIESNTVCDGKIDCGDMLDEEPGFCTKYECPDGYTKCADRVKCIEQRKLCDGTVDCLQDESDELCGSSCIQPRDSKRNQYKVIVRRCEGTLTICFPIYRYCDGVIDCPDASDETWSACTCANWGLQTCSIDDKLLCLHPEWSLMSSEGRSIQSCYALFNRINYPPQQDIKSMPNYSGRYKQYSLNQSVCQSIPINIVHLG